MNKLCLSLLLGTALLGATAMPSSAALTNIALGGNTTNEGWDELNVFGVGSGYGSFPGYDMWAPVASQFGSGDATLYKIGNGTGGGPYFGVESIYFGSFDGDPNEFGGTLGVQETTPLLNLQTVVFQIFLNGADGYDFHDNVLPVLNYTTSLGTTTIAASYSSLFDIDEAPFTNPGTGDPDTLYYHTYGLQYDLSGVSEEILSFNVTWEGVAHQSIYGLQLQQSDMAYGVSMLPAAVPEPGTLGLGLAAGLATFLRRRRMR